MSELAVRLEFALLGPIEVRRDGHVRALGRGRQRSLLAMLLVRANESVAADRLIDQLWGEAAPLDAANALQVHVSRLRRTLAVDGALETGAAGYRLVVAAGALDAERFEAAVQQGRAARAAGRLPDAAAALRGALAHWRGPALADCAYEAFAQPEIARLEELRLTALEELMDVELGLGQLPVAELERLVAEHPLRERLRGQLMTALYRGGRQADALAAYRQGREVLADELGLEPSPALRRLENEIMRHDLPVPAEPQGVPLSRPLAEARQGRIVGRCEELERAGAALASPWPCVVLIEGPAGIGKTRLAAELAGDAHSAGATILYGRAEADTPIPYLPFVEALRHHAAHDSRLEAGQLEPEFAAVADVVPELRARLSARAAHAPDWRLFAGLAAVVAELARTRPLLLVLDDLQHADHLTLRLLRHVMAAGTPLAVLGAYRDDEPGAARTLAVDLRNDVRLEHIRLAGLDPVASRELTDEPHVCEVAGGNPLLMMELLRERVGPRRWHRVPEGVQALLELRLARLDDPHGVLTAAAIIGLEFRLEMLEAAVPAAGSDVLAVVEQAIAARMVTEVEAGRFRFFPPLLRDAIRERSCSARRIRLERRIGELERAA